ncbi:MAG TPA: type II secretion system F family protein, partial [Thermoanaerobaculia bacterium]|nr:type II secretion system F family protein [Thermoanaerobaculia bacterium]
MPTFEWKGTARNGQTQSGVLVADSKDAVIAVMRRQQIVVTAVKEKGKEIALPKFGGGVPSQSIAIFTRQFSVMIDAGLPLVQCLEILGKQEPHKNFAAVILKVREDVE